MSENIYYRIAEFETLISQLDEYVLRYGQDEAREDVGEEGLWEAIFADSVDMGPTSLCIYAWDFLEANQTVLPQTMLTEMESLLAAIVPFLSRKPDTPIAGKGVFQFWPHYKRVGLTFGSIISPIEVMTLKDFKTVQTLRESEFFKPIQALAEKEGKYDFFVPFILGWAGAINEAALEQKCVMVYFLYSPYRRGGYRKAASTLSRKEG